jgi:hypothetical protein
MTTISCYGIDNSTITRSNAWSQQWGNTNSKLRPLLAKRMKSKTKDTYMEIQLAMLDQINFLACMYITMWATKKEENTWMIEANLICWLN